jgi:hypothetical protein
VTAFILLLDILRRFGDTRHSLNNTVEPAADSASLSFGMAASAEERN